jgi:XTP/dITP diphosphohydrolase
VKVVVASMNPDKLGELRELLDLPGVEFVSLRDVPGAVSPVEDGATLEANARIKALAAARLSGLPAIADDTGLEVDSLDGRPGVHAARYAGPGATYAANVVKLLHELAGVPDARRTARFRTVCVACLPDGRERVAEGVLEGRITTAPRGSAGFGYDPVFELAATGRTLAELEPHEKNALSHRALAVRNLRASLLELIGRPSVA